MKPVNTASSPGNAETQLGINRRKAKLGLGDPRIGSISKLAESINALNRQAVKEYTPLVEDIIHSRSRDVRHIEHILDGLLDFCGHDPVLQLYRRLCRYYWDIAPAATAGYVNAYREMWDTDAASPGNAEPQLGINRRKAKLGLGDPRIGNPGCKQKRTNRK